MNKTKIEWCDYTWNPVVGCKHDCWYCFSKKFNNRFKWIKHWISPELFVDRLQEPYSLKTSPPKKIFVCSMADLFGNWIPKEWIWRIIDVAAENSHNIFMFLTKNPKRYYEFIFPDNCWLGMTMTSGDNVLQDMNFLAKMPNKKFASIEPIMGDFSNIPLKIFDFVIVGAMTGNGKKNVIPKPGWIESIEHKNIFFKNNIKQ